MSWVINNHIWFVPSCLCTCGCLTHYLCHLVTSDILWVRVCIRFQHPQEKQRSENVTLTRVRGIHNDQFTSIMIRFPVIQDIATPRDFTSTGNTSKTIVFWGVFPDIVLFRYSLVTSCQVSTKVLTLTARQDWHLTMSHSKHLIEIKSHWLIHLRPSPWGPIGFLSWHKKVVIALIESN